FGAGIRAGQKLALPHVPCRGDVFHALHDVTPVVTYLENRAYDTIAAHQQLERKKAKLQKQARRDQVGQVQALSRKAFLAAQAQAKAIALADDVALLVRWLRDDIFAVSGLPYADRCALFDFIRSGTPSPRTALPASPRSGVHPPEKPPGPTLGFRRPT